MESSAKSIEEVVEEIMRTHRSLPARPGIDEVEAAKTLILNVDKEEQARIEAIARKRKSLEVPEELFRVLQEMQKNLVHFQSKEQKREALKLLDLDNVHSLFDDLILRASKCLPSSSASNSHHPSPSIASTSSTNWSTLSFTNSNTFSVASLNSPVTATTFSSGLHYDKGPAKSSELFTRDDSQDGEKLSLIKLASLIEVCSKKGTRDLNLQNKLMDQIEWLPDSIGKLSMVSCR
ncbi:hypothetical protein CsSME_00003136 [Camellia sinensis var. sinensis]